MKAFVLAGGAGTRLSPLTMYIPKGMIPINGRPVIDYVVNYLSRHGVNEVVMLLSHEDYDVFRNHLEDGSKFGLKISYSVSPRAGTAAALKHASRLVDGTFVVYYGDVLTRLNLSKMARFHREKKAICTMALSTGVKIDYGVGRVDEEGRVSYFAEKPVLPDYPVSIGVYMFEPKIIAYCSAGPDLAGNVLPLLLKKGERVYGFITEEPHHDIGSFKQLNQAKDLLRSRARVFRRKSGRRWYAS